MAYELLAWKVHRALITAKLNVYFETFIEVPRIRVGRRQTIDTLISEEALLLAKFLRNEKKGWEPRVVVISSR